MTKARFVLSLALALCFATMSVAQDEAKDKAKNKGKDRGLKQVSAQMMKTFEAAKLTDEQKEKATAIIKKHIGSLQAARKAVTDLLSKDQKKAKTAATKKAKEDGLKGPKATEAVEVALGMSDEDLAAYKAAAKKPQEITAKIKAAITELLTDEQKAAMPKRRAKGGAKGKGKKKKKDKAESDGNLQTVSLKLPNMT